MIDEQTEQVTRRLVRKTVKGLLLLTNVMMREDFRLPADLTKDLISKKWNRHLVTNSSGIDDEPSGPAFFQGSL